RWRSPCVSPLAVPVRCQPAAKTGRMKERGPSMYEMEGPRTIPLLRPIDRSTSGRCVTDHRLGKHPPGSAGCPTLPRSGVAPGLMSLLAGDVIPSAESLCAQGVSSNYVEGIRILNTLSTGRPTLSPDRRGSSTVRPHLDPQAVAQSRPRLAACKP